MHATTGNTLGAVSNPGVAIAIVSRNRLRELHRALTSCVAQDYHPLEVIVYDDKSDDAIEEVLGKYFPNVVFVRFDTQRGSVGRTESLLKLDCRYIVWLDDDAFFTSPSTISKAVKEFESASNLAVLALPFVEPYKSPDGQIKSSDIQKSEGKLKNFVACAVVINRSAALEVGGLRDFFFYYGEERDLAIRLINKGYEIRYANTPPVVHMASPKRNKAAQDFYSARNTILFDFLNLPRRDLAPALLIHTYKIFRYKLTLGEVPHRIWSIAHGFFACFRFYRHRRPVSSAAYRQYRAYPAHGPEPSSQSQLAHVGTHLSALQS